MASKNSIPLRRFSFFKGFSIRNKLVLKKLVVQHLDQENIFVQLESKVNEYEKNFSKNLFCYKLSLDFLKMHNDLRNWLLWEPETVVEVTREIIFRALDQLFSATFRTENFDKRLIIHLVGVPSDVSSTRLSSFHGVLLAVSAPYKFTRSAVYRCRSDGCPGKKGKRFVNVPRSLYCADCFGPIYEDLRSREVGEETECLFNVPEAFKDGGIHHPFIVKIKDEMYPASKLELGREYVVVEINGGGNKREYHLGESHNIFAPRYSNEPSFISLPSSLSQLYFSTREICGDSPWALVRAIASKMCSDAMPESPCLHLKMGLLLGLVAKTVPILGVGSDTLAAAKLYRSAGKLADRYVSTNGFRHLGGVTRSGHRAGTVWHEAGPLVLAGGGVCDLGDWTKYKKQDADYILRTVEKGQIMFDNETERKNFIKAVPLECTAWTFWDHRTNKKNLSLKSLVDVFGIPFLMDDKYESATGNIYFNYSQDLTSKEVIPEEEIKKYLNFVKTGSIIVTKAASELIKNYFVASRKERPDALPLGAIKTLTALSEAHARLSLRARVLHQDVAAVIYLYQEAITDLFGRTPHDFLPNTIWEPEDSAHVYYDKVLQQFTVWLTRYVSTFASGFVS